MEEKESKHILIKIFIFIVIILTILLISMRYINPYKLEVKEYSIESNTLPKGFDGFKIVHFTDLHYKTTVNESELTNIVEEINSYNPDIVMFTGDLIDDKTPLSNEDIKTLNKLLSKITSTRGKYYVTGNHDYSIKNLDVIYEGTKFKELKNEKIDLYYEGETPITIYGLPSAISDEQNYEILNEENKNFKIVLIHEPDTIDEFVVNHPDLVLAGHSHGGQVTLPFLKPFYLPLLAEKYYDEYYDINGTQLYISSGLGTSTLKLRLFNKPSFNLYRLYTK